MKRLGYLGPSLVVLVTLALVMTFGPGAARQIAYAGSQAKIQTIRDGLDNNATVAELSNSFKLVAEVVEPSVVHIAIFTKSVPHAELRERMPWFFGPRGPFPMDPEDESMTPETPEQENPDQGMDRYNVPRERGNGSGWVYDTDGHVVTNNHVVDKADKIVVRFHDGTEKQATVVGRDTKTDIAVLKVEGEVFHPAKVSTDPVGQGEIVFSFGSPFGNDFSMSQGIVSATGRQLGLLERQGYENFIQTDAAINPGNSGGPLTNLRGEVIGMNTAIATRTGSFAGIGFAIPADMIARVVPQLIENGKVTRGYLGIFIKDLDPKMAQTLSYDGKGVLVTQPIEGGPAAKGGMQEADIITKVQGQAVANAEQLRETVAAMPPGTEVELDVFRKGKQTTVKVTLEELPDQVAMGGSDAESPSSGMANQSQQILGRVGVRVTTFTPQMAEQLGVDHEQAVVVLGVREGSAAAEAGLLRGMLITGVMDTAVSTPAEFAKALDEASAQSPYVRLRVELKGQVQLLLLEVPKE
ncbi:MAG: trypsin-like peptidase domain-containing protein [Phycisphaeraceae bacterium]|nr:trypsin-like peptidase domain-containing protein [Phycisphaeraceae bacterium]